MDALVTRTERGLVAVSEEDENKLAKIPLGKVVKIAFGSQRNLLHHRKYFKLIQVAWDYQPQTVRDFYKDKEIFRKTIELACGHCDVIYDISNERFVEIPRSISFESMSQEDFSELYNKVIRLIVEKFLVHLSPEDLANFFEILDGN